MMLYQELAPIISNKEVIPGINLMWIESPDIISAARPGQFVMVGCDNGGERLLRRPISIHQTNGSQFAFLFAIVGEGTEWLSRRQPGDKIDLLGPMGNGFDIFPQSHNLLLVAGGMGIAPLCFLTRQALKTGRSVKLLAGAKTAGQLCPDPLMPEGCDIICATEDGTKGERGLITSLLPAYGGWADQVFACGPLSMYRSLMNLYPQDFKDQNVQVSLELRMGCGLGFCYACTIKTKQGLKQVCKDGPVFNLQDVVWEELR